MSNGCIFPRVPVARSLTLHSSLFTIHSFLVNLREIPGGVSARRERPIRAAHAPLGNHEIAFGGAFARG
jgi:hypothetical protein